MRKSIHAMLASTALGIVTMFPGTAAAELINFSFTEIQHFQLGLKNKQTNNVDYTIHFGDMSGADITLDTNGFLNLGGAVNGFVRNNSNGQTYTFDGFLGVDYRAYQETDRDDGTNTTYWTSQHTDLGNDMIDEQAGGFLGLNFTAQQTPFLGPLGIGLSAKMANIPANADPGAQNAYRELVGDGPFSFVLGELQAYGGNNIFKTWLHAANVLIGGQAYSLQGDLHAFVDGGTPVGGGGGGTEVPEPSSMLLLGAGALGFYRKRKEMN